MNNVHANPGRSGGPSITVRFVGQPPDEEVLCFAVGCAKKRAAAGPLTVVIETRPHVGGATHEVRLERRRGQVLVTEDDPEVLLAIRNAFDRLSGEAPLQTFPVALGGVEVGEESAPLWA